jgi:hypothetical protein
LVNGVAEMSTSMQPSSAASGVPVGRHLNPVVRSIRRAEARADDHRLADHAIRPFVQHQVLGAHPLFRYPLRNAYHL